MANITAAYPPGASTTRVSPGVASPQLIDMTARNQLDALTSQERQTGYRSVKPMYLPPPPIAPPQNTHPAGSMMNHGMGVAPPPNVMIPDKWYTVMDYAGNTTRVINPEYERWAAAHGQFDVGPDTTQFAPSMGGGQLPQEAGAGSIMPKPKTENDRWYDMPEWERTQMLSDQLYGGPGYGPAPASPVTPTQSQMASQPSAPPYYLARL